MFFSRRQAHSGRVLMRCFEQGRGDQPRHGENIRRCRSEKNRMGSKPDIARMNGRSSRVKRCYSYDCQGVGSGRPHPGHDSCHGQRRRCPAAVRGGAECESGAQVPAMHARMHQTHGIPSGEHAAPGYEPSAIKNLGVVFSLAATWKSIERRALSLRQAALRIQCVATASVAVPVTGRVSQINGVITTKITPEIQKISLRPSIAACASRMRSK